MEVKYSTEKEPFKLEKVLILNKCTALHIEKYCHPELSDEELEKTLRKRGIDYDSYLERYNSNKEFQDRLRNFLEKSDIKVKSSTRFNFSSSDVDWCDAVIPVGGDGTFLHAARYIHNNNKPIIGFNSDPTRSEGFLCLPKKYSSDIPSAISKLKNGQFQWLFRTRIRVTFQGESANQIPVEVHSIKPCFSHFDKVAQQDQIVSIPKPKEAKQGLPILALNEVFISEVFAAKVSLFEIRLNDSNQSVKIKSSGLCVCTGTGSTSWNLSMNRISKQEVHDVIKLYIERKNEKIDDNFNDIVNNILKKFNEKFVFNPEAPTLRYTIRDLISLGVWPNPKGVIESRGTAKTIEVKSSCADAAVIIDGGVFFPFNEGTSTYLETRAEDSLRTVVLSEYDS